VTAALAGDIAAASRLMAACARVCPASTCPLRSSPAARPGRPARTSRPAGPAGSRRAASRFPDLDPAALLTGYERDGWRLVCPGQDEWPAGLAGLDTVATAQAGGGPPALWVRGAGDLASVTGRCYR
jgi:DNA processing protein